MDDTWARAQREELRVWEHTASRPDNVLSEIAEVAGLVAFGAEHGLHTATDVIELGIGPLGIGWGALIRPSGRCIGVDPLPRLEVTSGVPEVDQLVTQLQGWTEFVQLDATRELPYEAGSFDLVVCDNVVDHTQDPAAILREAHRLLRAGGRLLFGVNVFSSLGIIKWRQVTTRLHPDDPNTLCHPHSFTVDEARELLRAAGFAIDAETVPGTRTRLIGRAFRYRALATRR